MLYCRYIYGYNFNRGYENRKKGMIHSPIVWKGKQVPRNMWNWTPAEVPLYKESLLVRNNTLAELKQYCRENQLKGFSKHTSKPKLSAFIMKYNF